MWSPDMSALNFYAYAMDLFMQSGHISSQIPEYANHSSEEFVYFDVENASLSALQRASLKQFNCVSRLFSVHGCAFFSINLLVTRAERSQAAHDIHSMLHPLIRTDATIVLFRHDDDILLSFVGFNSRCILSDWFENFDDAGYLIDKLDIVNMSLESGKAYFNDFLYIFARDYYFFKYNLMINDLIPIDLFNVNEGLYDPISRDQIDQIIHDQIFRSLLKYDTDYVPYDDDKYSETDTIDFDIDLMLLDEDEQESPFDEDRADEENDMYGDEDYQQNEYEFDDVDPEIFKDPTLMVKWLKKADNN